MGNYFFIDISLFCKISSRGLLCDTGPVVNNHRFKVCVLFSSKPAKEHRTSLAAVNVRAPRL